MASHESLLSRRKDASLRSCSTFSNPSSRRRFDQRSAKCDDDANVVRSSMPTSQTLYDQPAAGSDNALKTLTSPMSSTATADLSHPLRIFCARHRFQHRRIAVSRARDGSDFKTHLDEYMKRGIGPDAIVSFGRRLAWYAIARVMKPTVIVETGVAHGIGACVLCTALLRNAEEGDPGRYAGSHLAKSWRDAGGARSQDLDHDLRRLSHRAQTAGSADRFIHQRQRPCPRL